MILKEEKIINDINTELEKLDMLDVFKPPKD